MENVVQQFVSAYACPFLPSASGSGSYWSTCLISSTWKVPLISACSIKLAPILIIRMHSWVLDIHWLLIQCAQLYFITSAASFLQRKHTADLSSVIITSLLFRPFLGSSHLKVYLITSCILLKTVYKMPAVWIKSQSFSTSCHFSFESSVWARH